MRLLLVRASRKVPKNCLIRHPTRERITRKKVALVGGVAYCATRAKPGVWFRLFTDFQAAMQRLRTDALGPDQGLARQEIKLAQEITGPGQATISVHWIPRYMGVEGNELVDIYAREFALGKGGAGRRREASMAFLRAQRTAHATRGRREEGLRRRGGRNQFAVPPPGERPRIPREVRSAPMRIASHFFQLYSGHAMIALFLKEIFGWID